MRRREFLKLGLVGLLAGYAPYQANAQAPEPKLAGYDDLRKVLEQRGKYDSKYDAELRKDLEAKASEEPTYFNREILMETNPEEYLKVYVENKLEIERIKSLKLTPEQEKVLAKSLFKNRKVDYKKLDLSDKIRIYEYNKKMRETPVGKKLNDYQTKNAENVSKGIVYPLLDIIERLAR